MSKFKTTLSVETSPMHDELTITTPPFENLSVSKVNKFRDCPRRFYYEYFEKIPYPVSIHMVIGTAVDDGFMQPAIEQIRSGNLNLNYDELRHNFMEKFISLMYEHNFSEEVFADGVEMSKEVQKGFEPYIEYLLERFEEFLPTQLEVNHWFPAPESKMYVKGYVDFIGIERGTGEVVIADFKCKKVAGVEQSERFQLLTYAVWYCDTYGLDRMPLTELHIFLKKPQKSDPSMYRIKELEFTQEQINFLGDEYVQVEQAMQKNHFPANRWGKWCSPTGCPHYERCFALA